MTAVWRAEEDCKEEDCKVLGYMSSEPSLNAPYGGMGQTEDNEVQDQNDMPSCIPELPSAPSPEPCSSVGKVPEPSSFV